MSLNDGKTKVALSTFCCRRFYGPCKYLRAAAFTIIVKVQTYSSKSRLIDELRSLSSDCCVSKVLLFLRRSCRDRVPLMYPSSRLLNNRSFSLVLLLTSTTIDFTLSSSFNGMFVSLAVVVNDNFVRGRLECLVLREIASGSCSIVN